MFNSTIQRKLKECRSCGKLKYLFSRGRCKECATMEDTPRRMSNLPVTSRSVNRTPKNDIDAWFEMQATILAVNPYCLNCGEFIPEQYYRHATAHIVPKNLFPSVSTHPYNCLFLGAGCGCHSDYDHDIEKASKMLIWPKAVARFKIFEPLITERHKFLDLFKSKM